MTEFHTHGYPEGNEEGYPAKMAGRVDEDHDLDATVEAARHAGLTNETTAWIARSFGGWVVSVEVEEAIKSIEGVSHFTRVKPLIME